jgi:hypothetical protein
MIFYICRSETVSTVGNFAMVVWCIWQHRNNWVWNGIDSTKKVALRAVHLIGECRAVHTAQQTTAGIVVASVARVSDIADQEFNRDVQGNQLLRWQKPRDG